MEQIKLDIVPAGISPVAHASQFDNGRQIRFNLFNQGTPYTLTGAETVTMVVNGEEENITNTSDNYVIWDVAEEDCEKVGVIGCEIRIVLGSMLIGSKNFFLEVEMDPYDGKNIRIVTVGPADICTFETSLAEPLHSVLVNVVATGGNGTPDNPNPINGYTEANITRCGVNLFNKVNVISAYCDYSSKLVYNNDFKSVVVPLKNGVQYTFSQSLLGVFDRFAVCDSLEDSTTIYDPISPNITGLYAGTIPFTFTNSANKKYLICSVWRNTDTYTFDEIASTCQLELGSTATSYTPYNGQTYAIAFGQTVYGGVLDVTRGKLHVTWGICDLADYNYTYNSTHGAFYTYGLIGTIKAGTANILCTHYKTNIVGVNAMNNYEISTVNSFNTGNVIIKDSDYTDAATFKTALGTMGAKLAYELATPFDIDLTPEVISAIVGENNVFADCGDIAVEYLDLL